MSDVSPFKIEKKDANLTPLVVKSGARIGV
jgi:hypothetical protein